MEPWSHHPPEIPNETPENHPLQTSHELGFQLAVSRHQTAPYLEDGIPGLVS